VDERGVFQRGGWPTSTTKPDGHGTRDSSRVTTALLVRPADYDIFGRLLGKQWTPGRQPDLDGLEHEPKYVASTTLQTRGGRNTTVLSSEVAAAVRELNERQAADARAEVQGQRSPVSGGCFDNQRVDEITPVPSRGVGRARGCSPTPDPEIQALDLSTTSHPEGAGGNDPGLTHPAEAPADSNRTAT